MLNLAVCDDNIYELEMISSVAKKIINNKNIEFCLYQYSSLHALQEQILLFKYDILLLDIRFNLEKTTSLELAQKLSTITPNTQIIFITSYKNYFPDVYLCNHIYCILKEEIHKRLPLALDKAIQRLANNSNYLGIPITLNHNTHVLPINEIIYLEKSLRKICFNCRNPERYMDKIELDSRIMNNEKLTVDTYATFEEYKPLLSKSFVQSHRSYIVNLNYVKSFHNNHLVMLNNEIIPVSRSFKKNIMNSLVDLFFHE